RRGGGGSAFVDLRGNIDLSKTNLFTRPTQGTFGIAGAQVLYPGRPEHSVLYYRLSKLGRGRMPYFGSAVIDDRGVRLIRDWIQQMDSATGGNGDDPDEVVTRLAERETALVADLATAEGSEATALVDQLLATTSGALRLL